MERALTSVVPDVDVARLRQAFGLFPSGIAAIAAMADGESGREPVVLVASSFQVGISMDPALVLFAVQHTSSSWPRLRAAAAAGCRIGVSVLGEAHDTAARQLASRAVTDRFAGIQATTSEAGAHFVHGAPVWLECSIYSQVRAGDHDVVILEVHQMGVAPDIEPLVWHGSSFRALTPRVGAR